MFRSSAPPFLAFVPCLLTGVGATLGCSQSDVVPAQQQNASADDIASVQELDRDTTGTLDDQGKGDESGEQLASSAATGESRPDLEAPLVPSAEANRAVADKLVADAGAPSAVEAGGGSEPVTVFVAGDSIVSEYRDTDSPIDQAGWGQMLPEMLNRNVTVVNRARGGRTALWFSLEGELDRMLEESQSGDYLLVEFGTNDSHRTAEFTVNGQSRLRYADPDTDFKQQLTELYIEPARQRGVRIVLVTAPPRNSAYCTGGNSLGRWAQAMRELGEEQQVPVADMNTRMVDHLQAICPAPTPENIYFLRPDGSVDGTHFQEQGARQMARFILDELTEQRVGLADYITEEGRL